MSTLSAPFGFRPAYSAVGFDRAKKYTITSGYGTQLLKGVPVALDTNGTIVQGVVGANDILGIFAGCEYIDATGKPNVSNFWPAAQTVMAGTTPVVWVYDDAISDVFEVQADGSIAQTAIGDQVNITNITAGSTSTGLSQCTVGAVVGAGTQGQFRIVGFGQGLDNVPGDAFTIVQVQIARSQYVANKVAI